jgi:hypothetical protein
MLRRWTRVAKAIVLEEEGGKKPRAEHRGDLSSSGLSSGENEVPECLPEPETRTRGRPKGKKGTTSRATEQTQLSFQESGHPLLGPGRGKPKPAPVQHPFREGRRRLTLPTRREKVAIPTTYPWWTIRTRNPGRSHVRTPGRTNPGQELGPQQPSKPQGGPDDAPVQEGESIL